MSKLRKSARGQNCLVRIPGVCNHNPETTVLAHLNGGGMGLKTSDNESAFACYNCHQVIDGVVRTEFSRNDIKLFHLEGVIRTQRLWLKTGLLIIKE